MGIDEEQDRMSTLQKALSDTDLLDVLRGEGWGGVRWGGVVCVG